MVNTSIASTANGALVARQTYYAYGALRTSDGTLPTDYTFTGQRADASAGLMYYNARYYDAALGRFIQPDIIVPDQFNPQSLNRYSYVYNNPLRYTDPTGHCPLCVAAIAYAKIVIINAAVDTAIDFGIARLTGEPFHWGHSLAANVAIDAVTAGIGGKIAKGGKIATLAAKYGDEAGEIIRRVTTRAVGKAAQESVLEAARRAERRVIEEGLEGSLELAKKAAKQGDEILPGLFKYGGEGIDNYQQHHLWPIALGGPEEGWTVYARNYHAATGGIQKRLDDFLRHCFLNG